MYDIYANGHITSNFSETSANDRLSAFVHNNVFEYRREYRREDDAEDQDEDQADYHATSSEEIADYLIMQAKQCQGTDSLKRRTLAMQSEKEYIRVRPAFLTLAKDTYNLIWLQRGPLSAETRNRFGNKPRYSVAQPVYCKTDMAEAEVTQVIYDANDEDYVYYIVYSTAREPEWQPEERLLPRSPRKRNHSPDTDLPLLPRGGDYGGGGGGGGGGKTTGATTSAPPTGTKKGGSKVKTATATTTTTAGARKETPKRMRTTAATRAANTGTRTTSSDGDAEWRLQRLMDRHHRSEDMKRRKEKGKM